VIDDQNHSNDSNEHTVDIDAAHALCTEQRKKIATNNSANDSQYDIKDEAHAIPVKYFDGEKSRNQAKNNPTNHRNLHLPLLLTPTFRVRAVTIAKFERGTIDAAETERRLGCEQLGASIPLKEDFKERRKDDAVVLDQQRRTQP